MAIREAVRTAVETIVPPSPAELRQRLDQARQALLAAQEADSAARAALDVAYGADDQRVVLKAESDRAQARLALERAAGRVAALERQLAAAEAAQASEELAAWQRTLVALKGARPRQGDKILATLDQLQADVAALVATDEAIAALPPAVRGHNAVPGFNLGVSPLRAHLALELERRGITTEARPSSTPTLVEWLDLGNRTLP